MLCRSKRARGLGSGRDGAGRAVDPACGCRSSAVFRHTRCGGASCTGDDPPGGSWCSPQPRAATPPRRSKRLTAVACQPAADATTACSSRGPRVVCALAGMQRANGRAPRRAPRFVLWRMAGVSAVRLWVGRHAHARRPATPAVPAHGRLPTLEPGAASARTGTPRGPLNAEPSCARISGAMWRGRGRRCLHKNNSQSPPDVACNREHGRKRE